MVSRAWCFTLNNPTDEDRATIDELNTCRKYMCFGEEIGESGTPHLQGYVELSKPMRMSGLKALGGPWAKMHLEQRRGTREEAQAYCMKGDQPGDEFATQGKNGPNYGANAKVSTFGDWNTGQGSRTDLGKVRDAALEGGMRQVTNLPKINAQQIAVAEKYLKYNEEPRDWKPTVIWLWGQSGVGKSKLAREICANLDTYCKNTGTKWFDGYDGHEAVIFDDFRDDWWPMSTMLALLDRYEMTVEHKGGSRQFKAKMIVVTTPRPPQEHYIGTGENLTQLLRRINICLELKECQTEDSFDKTSRNEVCNEVEEGNTGPPQPPKEEWEYDTSLEELLKELCECK